MEETIKIAGTWLGELVYNDDHRPELQGKTMKFRLVLEENDGEFTGECVDTEGTGVIPEPASINGFIDDQVISFVKLYPHFYFVNDQVEIVKDEDKEPVEINYSGEYNAENEQFEGDWNAVYAVKQFTFGYAENLVSGTWVMKRV
ncbi:MAG: hypothetical protein JXB00_02735 [Bacteroidales bacterium]|nr:hypothetical protein [Bacteroidales bacterium]